MQKDFFTQANKKKPTPAPQTLTAQINAQDLLLFLILLVTSLGTRAICFVIEIVIEIVIKILMQTLDQINFTIGSTSESYPLSVCMDMHRSTLVITYVHS